MTCGTDNQGNMLLLDELLMSKYPTGVVLVELSCQLGLRRAELIGHLDSRTRKPTP